METIFSVVMVPHDETIPLFELNNVEIDAEIEQDPAERINVLKTLLVRDRPMLYSHHRPHTSDPPNIRATRVGMVCGHFGIRFRGDVMFSLDREHLRVKDLSLAAATVDVRSHQSGSTPPSIPFWLANANRSHFRDIPVLNQLANVMSPNDEGSSTTSSVECSKEEDVASSHPLEGSEFVTTVPICIECRRPTDMLCPYCTGVYFCSEHCRSIGYDLIDGSTSGLRPTLTSTIPGCCLGGPTNASAPRSERIQKEEMNWPRSNWVTGASS